MAGINYLVEWGKLLILLLHLSLQLSEYVEVTKCGACCNVLNLWSLVLLSAWSSLLGGSLLLLTSGILEGAAVREDDTLRILVELNHLEWECLTSLSL